MLKKKTNVIEDIFTGYDLYQEDILSAMNFLYQQIEEMDNHPEKSLFFQNPQITEGWLVLVRAIKKIKKRELQENDKEWEQRSEPYAVALLARRELFLKFRNLYRAYYDPLYKLWMGYSGWLDGECISADCMEALSADKYEQILKVEDINHHIEELNNRSLGARYGVYKTLSGIFELLQAMMNRGGQIVIDMNPSIEDFARAIDDDLRGLTRNFGEDLFKEMKEDLNRHYKVHRTDRYTPELWGEMLSADENALKKAKVQQLAECDEPKQEHWGEDMKKQMEENGRLMQQILSLCHTEELLDLGKAEIVEPFIELLTPDNLDMFYEIIVRRSLIQCEMFPGLKKQHDEWLNNVKEQQPEENNETWMDTARQSKLDEIIGILQKGDWKQPATADNVKLLLNTVFGKDTSLLDEGDIDKCADMWALVEGGGGERMLIVPSNLAGFFKEENLLKGSPKEISNALFSNGNQVNNINKGNPNHCSEAFKKVIPFLKKYIDKIIRQKKF